MKAGYFAQHERAHSAPSVQPPALLHCANCDIEIAWVPTISGGQAYCCLGCAQGGPCSCDYSEHASTPPRQ